MELIQLSGSDVSGAISGYIVNSLPTLGTLYLDNASVTAISIGDTHTTVNGILNIYYDAVTDGDDVFTYSVIDNDGTLSSEASVNITNSPSGALLAISSTKGVDNAAGGALVNGRTSTATVVDYEGKIQNCKANEIRHSGARRVENVIVPADISAWGVANGTKTLNIPDPDGGNGAITLKSTDISGRVTYTHTYAEPGNYKFSIYIRRRLGSGSIQFYTGKGSVRTTFNLQITSEWQKISAGTAGIIGLTGNTVGILLNTIGDEVDLYNPLLSKGVRAAEDIVKGTIYNAGIPSVKYFCHYNNIEVGTIYGDSLTDAVDDLGGSVAALAGIEFLSRGSGGWTLQMIHDRYVSEVPYLDMYGRTSQFTVIEGGVNTLTSETISPVAAMKALMSSMTYYAGSKNVGFLVCTIAPFMGSTNWTLERQGWLEEYNTWIRATYTNKVLDLYAIYGDSTEPRQLLSVYDSGDSLHPNAVGHHTGSNEIVRLLNTEFPPTTLPNVSILHEGQGTNILPHSENFNQWILNAASGVGKRITVTDTVYARVYLVSIPVVAGEVLTMSVDISASQFSQQFMLRVSDANNSTFMFTPNVGRVSFTRQTANSGTSVLVFIYLNEGQDIGHGVIGDFLECSAQLETSSYATSYIPTTTAAVTRAADSISVPLALDSNFYQSKGVLLTRFTVGYSSDTSTSSIFSIFNGLGLVNDSATINMLSVTDGTNTGNIPAVFVAGDTLLVAVTWNDAESLMSIGLSLDNGITYSPWVNAAYDGLFTSGTDMLLAPANPNVLNFHHIAVRETPNWINTTVLMQLWVEDTALVSTT